MNAPANPPLLHRIVTGASVLTALSISAGAAAQYSGGPGVGGANSCLPQAIVLPVDLLWLEVACDMDTPLLTWATGSETNNSHFIIERSTDAERWEHAGQVKSTSNSQQLTEYAWHDERPLFASVVYYRLRQVDVDGREEVLAVLPLASCHNNFTELSVMPNPTDGPIEVRWATLGKNGIAELRFVDMHGRTLRVERIAPDATRAEMDLTGIAAGTYTLLGLDTQGMQVGSARVMRW